MKLNPIKKNYLTPVHLIKLSETIKWKPIQVGIPQMIHIHLSSLQNQLQN